MSLLRMENLDLVGKTVLIRVDLNVPISEGKVLNDNRLLAILPTIRIAMPTAGKIILMSRDRRPYLRTK